MDPLFAIYRSRADKLLAELWAVHLAAGAVAGLLCALLTSLRWWAMPIALVVACGLAMFWLSIGERRLRSAMVPAGSAVCSPADEPRLANVVDGVCLLVGVPVPTLAVAPSSAANATAFGRRSDRSTLVVTQGLLDALNRIELEAVVARLLTQIRDGRAAYLTTAVTTVGFPALLWPALWPLVQARTEREASTGNDFDDDTEAVRLTRYPPGLADALETMSRVGVNTSAPQATWPLWLADPRAAGARPPDELPDYRADLETRVAVLREF
ncbi:MAG: M48 family metalloprotease [Acidimicrobiaceae bacterium]|nr:M48 family metalloprotease [Acidimicrobiaceae bacterium]MDE0496749.1 M48 family metalloprotease [Acidimicrobiaceae bacterium]